jgi:hypothetical protein
MKLNINVIHNEISHSLLYNHLCYCFVVTFPIHKWVDEIRGQCYWSLKVVLLLNGSFVLKQSIC